MLNYIMVFIGGGIGAIMRFAFTLLSIRLWGTSYPWGTFIVNITGCLFLGFVLAFAANKVDQINPHLVLFLTVGIAGGFTTFSTFSYETLVLIQKGQIVESLSYIILSPALGLLSAYLGVYLAKSV